MAKINTNKLPLLSSTGDKCNPASFKDGERLSRISYLKVVNNNLGHVTVRNEQGMEWSISSDIVAKECYSCEQVLAQETMTRTELIKKFCEIDNAVFTVCFNKQPKLEDAFDAVANKGTIKSNKDLKKELSAAMKGEERILVGYVLSRDIALGRTMVVDLEQEADNNVRLVDHRTLNWFICQNVKYIVKSK